MRLTQIRDVLAVVEAGSIRAAARNLGVAQPTITKSVRSLEAELHVQLLARNARGIVPTPYGRAFFARARVAHSELRKAEEEAAHGYGRSNATSDAHRAIRTPFSSGNPNRRISAFRQCRHIHAL